MKVSIVKKMKSIYQISLKIMGKYYITESTLRDWIKNKKNYENISSDKLNNTTLHRFPWQAPEVKI